MTNSYVNLHYFIDKTIHYKNFKKDFKLNLKVIFATIFIAAIVLYWKITKQEYIGFGPHIKIESWKVGEMCGFYQ